MQFKSLMSLNLNFQHKLHINSFLKLVLKVLIQIILSFKTSSFHILITKINYEQLENFKRIEN